MGNFNDCGALTSEQKSYRVGKMLSAQLRLISDIVYHQAIHLVESSISTVHYDENSARGCDTDSQRIPFSFSPERHCQALQGQPPGSAPARPRRFLIYLRAREPVPLRDLGLPHREPTEQDVRRHRRERPNPSAKQLRPSAALAGKRMARPGYPSRT